MKNLLFFLICLCFLSSCAKVDFESSKIENFSAATKDVMTSSTISEMKERYLDLSINEREVLWKAKLKHIIANDDNELNEKQIAMVKKISDFISFQGMEKLFNNPEIGESFIEQHLTEIESNFSKPQQFLLIELPYFSKDFSLANSEKILAQLEPNATSLLSCNCLYNISCVGSCNKTAGVCEPTKDGGCGFLLQSQCKGRCDIFP